MDDPSLIGADNERLFNLLFYYFYTDKYNDMQPGGRWQQGRRQPRKLSTNGTRMEGAGSCWLAQVSHKTRRRKWWWTIHLRYIQRVNDVCCPTVEQQQTAGHQHSAPSISSPPCPLSWLLLGSSLYIYISHCIYVFIYINRTLFNTIYTENEVISGMETSSTNGKLSTWYK